MPQEEEAGEEEKGGREEDVAICPFRKKGKCLREGEGEKEGRCDDDRKEGIAGKGASSQREEDARREKKAEEIEDGEKDNADFGQGGERGEEEGEKKGEEKEREGEERLRPQTFPPVGRDGTQQTIDPKFPRRNHP